MFSRISRFGLALILLSGVLTSPATEAARPIPEAPYYYVLDEAKVLPQNELYALQTLLIRHDHATGEQFLIAIFDSLEGEDLVQFTNQVFEKWKIGQRGKDNGVLLALYWKDRKARIEVGYGLEPILTDAKSKQVLEETLIPELKADRPGRALAGAAFEILRILESPLVSSGDADSIIRGGGLHQGRPGGNFSSRGGWIVWLVSGIFLIMFVLSLVTSADAHFTRSGWIRPRPWDNIRRRSHWGGFGGGGGGFGGGGFGGFGGGGGRSGGGGASGSW